MLKLLQLLVLYANKTGARIFNTEGFSIQRREPKSQVLENWRKSVISGRNSVNGATVYLILTKFFKFQNW